MPEGQRLIPPDDHVPRIVPGGAGTAAPPTEVERVTGDSWWHHVTIPTDAEWDPHVLEFGAQVAKLVIDAGAADVLYLAFGSVVGVDAGGYDLRHPGGGIFEIAVPSIDVLALRADQVGSAPNQAVEIYAFAGAYAEL